MHRRTFLAALAGSILLGPSPGVAAALVEDRLVRHAARMEKLAHLVTIGFHLKTLSVALSAHFQEEDDEPQDLDVLAPEFVNAAPRCPGSGRPYLYVPTEPDGFQLHTPGQPLALLGVGPGFPRLHGWKPWGRPDEDDFGELFTAPGRSWTLPSTRTPGVLAMREGLHALRSRHVDQTRACYQRALEVGDLDPFLERELRRFLQETV